MDLLRIAARTAIGNSCPECSGLMLYDDGRDQYECVLCNFVQPNTPSSAIVASRKNRARSSSDDDQIDLDIPEPKIADVMQLTGISNAATEFSCRVEISLSADFEGDVARTTLLTKLQNEIMAALESAISTTARELRLQPTGVTVTPVQIECTINDTEAP